MPLRYAPMAVGTYTLSSGFGPRWGTFHYGLDFAADDGTPVYAAQAGTVAYIGAADGFGQWIVIDHPTESGSGTTVYGHMWNAFATGLHQGDHVEAGQLIAFVGSNGEATGPHLHFEVHPTVWRAGSQVDPEPWLVNVCDPGEKNTAELPVQSPGDFPETWFGIDISSYQSGLDMARVKNEGFAYVIGKATEGADYQNPEYQNQRDGARANGLFFAAYHYVRPGSVSDQADNFERTEPNRSVCVMLDHESGSGDIDQLRQVHDELVARGYRVILTYLPHWYWQDHLGSPNLSGLPRLMTSNYPNGSREGCASDLYPGDDHAGWHGYGGIEVAIYQFADTGLVAGTRLDVNAFKGTHTELSTLFGVDVEGIEELDMSEALTILKEIRYQLTGGQEPGQFPGLPQLGQNDDGSNRTLTDSIADIRQRIVTLDKRIAELEARRPT
ncbi:MULTISPECIES: peptidoglycan DD-metalloendopeptidase family protein [unclassified Nocardia]|uniref:peptidoglycan DD-metalloendopeptidase family protein n=1 Tax=unclassified Nocardia TaxID=2637762 RepID=UPI001CE44FAD|nr:MULTISPECIES: peptidoglycan DD-metalloendopeptidase family protein [unclassified Nocardia]